MTASIPTSAPRSLMDFLPKPMIVTMYLAACLDVLVRIETDFVEAVQHCLPPPTFKYEHPCCADHVVMPRCPAYAQHLLWRATSFTPLPSLHEQMVPWLVRCYSQQSSPKFCNPHSVSWLCDTGVAPSRDVVGKAWLRFEQAKQSDIRPGPESPNPHLPWQWGIARASSDLRLLFGFDVDATPAAWSRPWLSATDVIFPASLVNCQRAATHARPFCPRGSVTRVK
jgi:hypothetical protein